MATRDELNRARLFFVLPTWIISFILFIILRDDLQQAGLLALGMTTIALIVYSIKGFEKELVGIKSTGNLKMILFGVGIGGLFYVIQSVIPAFAIAFPNLNLSLSEDLRAFLVTILFPIVETVFFQGVLLAVFIKSANLKKDKEWVAITIVALIAAATHLLAYGVVLQELPSFLSAVNEIVAQSGLFLSAFLIFWVWGYIVRMDGFKNLVIVAVSHVVINSIIYGRFAVVV